MGLWDVVRRDSRVRDVLGLVRVGTLLVRTNWAEDVVFPVMSALKVDVSIIYTL